MKQIKGENVRHPWEQHQDENQDQELYGALSDKYMCYGFSWGMKLLCSPYIIHQEDRRVTLTRSKVRLALWVLSSLAFVSYTMFIAYNLSYWLAFKGEEKYSKEMIAVLWATLYLMVPICVMMLCLLKDYKELLQLFVQSKKLSKHYKEMYEELRSGRSKRRIDRSGLVLAILCHCIQGSAANITLVLTLLPLAPTALTYVLEDPDQLPAARFGLHALNAYLVLFGVISILAWVCPLFPFAFLLLDMLKEMSLGRERYHSLEIFRSQAVQIQMFKRVGVFLKAFKSIYCTYPLPCFQWSLTLCAIYCVYGSIRNRGILSLSLMTCGITCMLFLAVIILVLGRIHEYSLDCLTSWKGHMRRPVFRKTLCSLRPTSITMGSYYILHCQSVVVVFQIIFDNTANLLMAD